MSKKSSFGAPTQAPKYKRRAPTAGENLPAMKTVMKEINNQDISVEDFLLLISPHTGDKGAALTKVMTEDLNNFRKMVIKVYDTMSQDVSDVLANEQMELAKVYGERQRLLVDKMMRSLQQIKDINPNFDFRQYYNNPDKYLGDMFKMADLPDEEEIEAARRQMAYHRLQWLRSEGDRLHSENVKLQERLTQLKKMKRKEITEAVMMEQEAERKKAELEREQAAKHEEFEELCEELHETIVAEEKKKGDAKKLEQKKSMAQAKKRASMGSKTSAAAREDWNVTAAAEIESAQLGEATASASSVGQSSMMSSRKGAAPKKPRQPLRARPPFQNASEDTVSAAEQSGPKKIRQPLKARPPWQNASEDTVSEAEQSEPKKIRQPLRARPPWQNASEDTVSVAEQSGPKKTRQPLRPRPPWQKASEDTISTAEQSGAVPKKKTGMKKKRPELKKRPEWKDVDLEEFNVPVREPETFQAESTCPPTCGVPPRPETRAPSPGPSGRRSAAPRDTWGGFY